MKRLTLVLICAFQPAIADTLQCSGHSPNWTLTLDDEQGEFAFPSSTQMDTMLVTKAEGLDWPRAYSLIGERDTAIVLIENELCSEGTHRAHIMTQRGQTPILLTGCCQAKQ